MGASEIIREESCWRCNCRAVIARKGGYRRRGEILSSDLVVRGGSWDCPSCGLDKKHSVVAMFEAAEAVDLATFTYAQPRALDRHGSEVTPPGFELCNRSTHVYMYVSNRGRKSLRWRVLASCAGCCARSSEMKAALVKRIRRVFPEFQYFDVIEDQKNGALHRHLGVVGLPQGGDRASLERWLRGHWVALGGGHQVDLRGGSGTGKLGRYLAKYLTKRQDQRMARGYRRWSRSAGFAPEVVMAWSQKWRRLWADSRSAVARDLADAAAWSWWSCETEPAARRLEIVGWMHPLLRVMGPERVWVTDLGGDLPPDTATAVRRAPGHYEAAWQARPRLVAS